MEPEVKKTCSFEVYNIPEDDYREFEKISRRYRGNSFAPALREMIARYYIYEEIAALRAEFEAFKQNVAQRKVKKTVRTMRGEIDGKIREDESESQEG